MANNRARQSPTLGTWAEVDPARYPFDPIEAPSVVREVVLGLPLPGMPSERRLMSESQGWQWAGDVGMALADRYGSWAYGATWVPLTTVDVGAIADRLTRDVLGLSGKRPASLNDDWPDT